MPSSVLVRDPTARLLAAEEALGPSSLLSEAESVSPRSESPSGYSPSEGGSLAAPYSLTPSLRWLSGAAGAGLLQAAMALSARPDAGAATIGTAGTAMGVGVWLYGHGVRRTFLDAIEGGQASALGEGAVALAGCLGSGLGIGLASLPSAPARVAGVGVVTASTAAFHHTLARSYIRDEVAFGQTERLGDGMLPSSRDALAWGAAGAIVIAGVIVGATSQVGAAEAAAVALFCHAVIGTTLATYGATNRWRRGQAAS